jgi:hypothetical protein
VLAGCLSPVFIEPTGAEVDVTAGLVGRWEGTAEVPSVQYLPSRVLLIKNVRQDATTPGAGKWKADGSYGVTADKLGRVGLTISVVEPTVTVEFTTPLALHVTMTLMKPNVLEGTIVSGGGARAHRIHLGRRE